MSWLNPHSYLDRGHSRFHHLVLFTACLIRGTQVVHINRILRFLVPAPPLPEKNFDVSQLGFSGFEFISVMTSTRRATFSSAVTSPKFSWSWDLAVRKASSNTRSSCATRSRKMSVTSYRGRSRPMRSSKSELIYTVPLRTNMPARGDCDRSA